LQDQPNHKKIAAMILYNVVGNIMKLTNKHIITL
jgi:hypothetical protein